MKWNDQFLIYQAVNQNIEGLGNSFTLDGWVGPGYVTLFRLFHYFYNTDELYLDLIKFNQLMIVFTLITMTYTVLVVHLKNQKLHKLNYTYFVQVSIIFFILAFIYYFSGIFQYTIYPWTNFVAMLMWQLAFYILLSLYFNEKYIIAKIILVGVVVAFTYQTRQLDGIILFSITIIIISLRNFFRDNVIVSFFKANLFLLFGFLTGIVIIGLNTGVFSPFNQYKMISKIFPGYKSPDVLGIPVRFIQVFLDPCFYSMCRYNDFNPLKFSNSRIWDLPVGLSLPLIISAIISSFLIMFVKLKISKELKYILRIFIIATWLHFFGYLTLPVINGSVLKYGTSREFISGILILNTATLVAMLSIKSKMKVYLLFGNVLLTLGVFANSQFGPFIKFSDFHLRKVQVVLNGNCNLTSSIEPECVLYVFGITYNDSVLLLRPKGHIKVHTPEEYKWFKVSESGKIDKDTLQYIRSCPDCLVDVLPIIVGLNGTPVYDLVQGMFRIYPGYSYSIP